MKYSEKWISEERWLLLLLLFVLLAFSLNKDFILCLLFLLYFLLLANE